MHKRLSTFLRDSLVLAGSICAVVGMWLAWPPLGLVLGGVAMAAFGIFWEMDRQRHHEQERRNRRDGV